MMEDFTKHFKDRLDNEGDYPPTDAAWHRVEQGLVGSGGGSFLGGWKNWLALGVALLLGFGLSEAWHTDFNQDKDISVIDVNNGGVSPEKEIVRELIERVVYDTVVQYVYLDKSIEQKLAGTQNELAQLQRRYKQTRTDLNQLESEQKDFLELNSAIANALGIDRTVDNLDHGYVTKQIIEQLNTFAQVEREDDRANRSREESKEIYAQSLLGLPSINLTGMDLPRLITPSIGSIIDYQALRLDHNKKSLIRSLTPDYVRIGIAGMPLAKAIFSENDGGSSETNYGLYTELLFSRHISVKAGVNLRSSKAKIEDEELAFSYPNPMVIDPNAIFNELYIDNHYLDIPIALKYRIWDHKVIAPYSSVGVVFTKNREQEYRFEFESQQDETYVSSEVEGGPLSLASLRMALGVDYTLSSRIYVFSELGYRYNFNISESEVDKVSGIGLNMGVAYEF